MWEQRLPEAAQKRLAFLARHGLKLLAGLSLLAVAAGMALQFGAGWALIAVGGLLWLDLFVAGQRRRAGKP